MKSAYLYVAVSVSGAAVLAVEIAGTRVLGPFYGVGLFLWSALITVTLAALSAGYALGGRWADRRSSLGRLAALLLGAGVWLLVTPSISRPILSAAEPLGLRAAVLSSAVVLFVPPLTLLGMVSPHAIRLKAKDLGEVGRTAGDLYAVSTVASVIAALVTGFFLIPNVGVRSLMLIVGAALVATASIGLLAATRSRRGAAAAVLALIAAVAAWWPLLRGDGAPAGVLAIRQSPYAELRVVDFSGMRMLLVDGGVHTVVDLESGQSMHPHVNALDLARMFFDREGRLLLVGLGGGSVANQYAAAGWSVDAVEIDPVVVDLARRYFGVSGDRVRVFCRDGRRYLSTTGDTYDVVVMDAFGSSSIPFHLITREAFRVAKKRLSPGGILAINLEAVGWRDVIVRSVAATLRECFATVYALPTMEPPTTVGNVVLFASDSPLDPGYELPAPPSRLSADYDRVHAWDNRFVPDTDGVPVVTDDRNPSDVWADRINLAARRQLHEYFAGTSLGW